MRKKEKIISFMILIENILFSVILVFLVLKKHIYGLMDAAFFYRFCKVSIVFFFILMGVREKQEICERKDKQICSCCTQLKIYWITLFLLFDVHFGIVTEELLWFLGYVSIVFCIFICYNWHKYGRNRKNEDTKSEKIHTQK